MTRHGSSPIVGRVLPNRVIPALSDEAASVPAQVLQQFTPFHEAALCGVTLMRLVAVNNK